MDEADALRPIVAEAIEKFRFGAAALVLRRISEVPGVDSVFVKHLADIYDNLHILWLSPEHDFRDIRRFAFPVLTGLRPSEIELRYFEQDKDRFRRALQELAQGPRWEAAGSLLKSYYCLSNGSNLGALILFGRTLRLLQKSEKPFPDADSFLPDIENCVAVSVGMDPERSHAGLRFSFYMEYDRVRIWIRDQYSIDIYDLQRHLSPKFRFGGH